MAKYDWRDHEEGPVYPDLGPAVAKLRRLPCTPENVAKHGAAVLAAFKSQNDAALHRAMPTIPKPVCDSGTWHNTGEAILAAMRQQHLAALHKRPFPDRYRST